MPPKPGHSSATPTWGRLLRGFLRHAGWAAWALVAAWAWLAWQAWQARCESFGCTYLGVMWVALAGLWALVLAVALVVRWLQARRGLPTAGVSGAVGALVGLGGGLVLYWWL